MNLAQLAPAQRERLLAGTATISFARNDAVYRAGDVPNRLYFVDSGRIKVVRTHASGAETIVGIRVAGDAFGESSALGGEQPRPTSAIAIEAGRAFAVPAETMRAALAADAGLARLFAAGIAQRLTDAERELTELAGKSVPGRLVDALGRLAATYGEDAGDGCVRIGINLTHNDLADLIGTSRETLTKELSVLADVGLVRVTHKTVTLVTPQAFPFVRRS